MADLDNNIIKTVYIRNKLLDVLNVVCYYLNVQEETSTLKEVFSERFKINIILYPCRLLIEQAPNKIRTRVN